jgi:hypothetical protein
VQELAGYAPFVVVGTTSRPPKWIKPQLTRLVDEAPAGDGSLHEIKYDGYRKPVPAEVMTQARRLARRTPKTGKARSLRSIAAELAKLGHVGPRGEPYHAGSVRHMLA